MIAAALACAALGAPVAASAAPIAAPARAATTCADGGGAWIGSFGFGVNCMDAKGWEVATKASKSLTNDQIQDIEQCGDKTVVIHTLGISTRTKGKWKTDRMKSGISSPTAIDCDAKNTVWIAHFDGVSQFDGKTWKTTKSDKLGSGANVKVLKDVTVGPDGKVWVATSNSVAMYDGSAWKVWEEGKGFPKQQFFNRIAIDSKGTPWVTAIGGVYTLEDNEWMLNDNSDLISSEGLFIDDEDRVFVGTYSNGLFVYEDGGWQNYNRENSDIPSNHVREIAVDGRGRVWVATEYGLSVLEKDEWATYQMSNSGMVDNDVHVLEVEGDGPDLPKPTAVKTGTLAGLVTADGKKPAAGVEIEVCVEFIGSSFNSKTPCGDQPFSKVVKTDKDGKFEFKDLPVGFYGIVFKQPSGNWARLVTEFGIGSERIAVSEGKITDDIELDLSKVKSS